MHFSPLNYCTIPCSNLQPFLGRHFEPDADLMGESGSQFEGQKFESENLISGFKRSKLKGNE